MRQCSFATLAAVQLIALTCTTHAVAEGDEPTRPNVLILVADDQGYADLSAYEHSAPDIETPNLDRLARRGSLFTQAYVTAPVCSPSRSGWNTGVYQQRFDPAAGWGPSLPSDRPTLAERLKSAGYATGKVGKSDFGTAFHRMDVREYPLNHGYDEFLGFSAHAHDFFLLSEEIEKLTPDPKGTSAALGPLFHNRTRKSYREGYTTEIFTDAAVEFLERHQDHPFFLTVSYNAVHHLIHEVPDRYLAKHGVKKIPNYDPATMGQYLAYYDKYRKIGPITDEEMRKYYLANLNCLDDNIGRVLDALDRLNLTENTLVVFFSDNGGSPMTGACNRPLRGAKYTMFDGGIRVPFIVSWKGSLPDGQVYRSRVSSLDIVPTCLEAAGCSTSAHDVLDGKSFLEALKKDLPSPSELEPLCWRFQDQWAVREGPYKLVQTSDQKAVFRNLKMTQQVLQGPQAPSDRPMLFNLADDPGEQNDLYEEHPEVVARMEALYQTWKEQ